MAGVGRRADRGVGSIITDGEILARVVDASKGTEIVRELQIADSPWSRSRGLLGRQSLPDGEGMLIRPSFSVHTAFMKFVIDVVFLDKSGRVVKVVPDLKPFRMAMACGAHGALELPAGAAARYGVEPGDQLTVVEEVNEARQ